MDPWFVVCVDGEIVVSIYGPFPTQDDATIYQMEIDNSSYPCDCMHIITDKEPPLYYKIISPVTRTQDMYKIRRWMDGRELRELAFKGYPLS